MRATRMRATQMLILGMLLGNPGVAQETDPATSEDTVVGPGAYETLEAVRRAYRELGSYQDHGEIEHQVGNGSRGERYYFSTAAGPGGSLVFRTVPARNPSHERVLWSEAGTAQVYDRRLDQIKPVSSMAAELAHGFGDGGFEALRVPALLAGSASGLDDPEGIAIEGPEPCGPTPGGAECWLLTLSQMAGDVESLLWVGRDDHLIRRLEVILHPPMPGPSSTWKVHHVLQVTDEPVPEEFLAFQPPMGARQVEQWDLTVLNDTGADPADEVFDIGYVEEITVEILSLPVRIVDRAGAPVEGLRPQDLEVRIGNTPVEPASLEWVSTNAPGAGPVATASLASNASSRPSRTLDPLALPTEANAGLKIFFVQTDFEPTRIRGHLRVRPLVEELLRSFHPDDRIAVLTFDSHLRLWLDFTTDRQAAGDILYEAIKPGGQPLPRRPRRGPSLLAHLDLGAARQVASTEKALAMTADALAEIPGPKEMIFVGWGMGLYRAGAVHMTPDFGKTMAALGRAEVTVFVLDVTEADWHALEAGLKTMAQTTGGSYQSTFHFASQTTRRLARILRGHYVLTVDRGAYPEASGPLRIHLPGHDGQILFRSVVLR